MAADESFDGLEFGPIPGLVPLGLNPDSGFWEFWLVNSGTRPRWKDGRMWTEKAWRGGVILVLLPGGRTWVGPSKDPSSPRYFAQAYPKEQALLEVTLAPFFISRFELTQAQWQKVMSGNPSQYPGGRWDGFGGPGHPVERTVRDQAAEAARRLGLELPTESQWEYAARGGVEAPWWTGRDPASLQGKENVAGQETGGRWMGVTNTIQDVWPVHTYVGTTPPNPFGLHDVLGNVSEWCRDGFAPLRFELREGDGLQHIPGAGSAVGRGGSFGHSALHSRVTARQNYDTAKVVDGMGLRPVLNIRRH